MLGFLLGTFIVGAVDYNNEITLDTILTVFSTTLAIIAATVLLPMRIQPLMNRRNLKHSLLREDLMSLHEKISVLSEILLNLNVKSNNEFELSDRKRILYHQQEILALASSIKDQSLGIDCMQNFEATVYKQLAMSKEDFTDNIMPGDKLNEKEFFKANRTMNNIKKEIIKKRTLLL